MISKKDAQIISYLRKNAREKITDIAKQTGIPATTIYDRVRVHEKGLIKRHVALLDFSKLGLNTTAMIAIKASKEKRDKLNDYLKEHKNVNSLYRVNYGYDFIVECIFENPIQVEDFVDNLRTEYDIEEAKIYSIIHEVKKEGFLTDQEHIENG